MATWVIGDIHGCYHTFEMLLSKLRLSDDDRVICVGDLINRGPDSELVLNRFMVDKQLTLVLGNHDCAYLFWGLAGGQPPDMLFEKFAAHPKHQNWLEFLKKAPLLYEHPLGIIVHAGIWPWTSFQEQKKWAAELSHWMQQASIEQWAELRATYRESRHYGEPIMEQISSDIGRLCSFLDIFTKIRYVNPLNRHIDFRYKGYPLIDQPGLVPWFQVVDREIFVDKRPVLFGHWSSLSGLFECEGFLGLDTGCVWGGELTAYCLETQTFVKQKKVEPGHVVGGRHID